MVERLVLCCGVYILATQWRAACNNQSETSVADACAAVCKRPSLTLYQPVAKVISALPRAIFQGWQAYRPIVWSYDKRWLDCVQGNVVPDHTSVQRGSCVYRVMLVAISQAPGSLPVLSALMIWSPTGEAPSTPSSAVSIPAGFLHSTHFNLTSNRVGKGAITSKIKHVIKLKTSPARLAHLLQPSLAFCFSLQPMTAHRPVRRHWLQAKTKC